MKVRHSDSLLLVWQIAALEAKQLTAQELEPDHLFLGLLKVVDVDLLLLVANAGDKRDLILEELLREVRKLREVFTACDLNARNVRRRLRHSLAASLPTLLPPETMHRNQASRDVFRAAEARATLATGIVFPLDLLTAVIQHPSKLRDRVLIDQSVDVARLITATQARSVGGHDAQTHFN